MSLITPQYFIGPLTIAQISQPAVVNNLQLFINRLEPQIMEAALGYDLWQDFMTGLAQPTIAPQWLNLRDGFTFKSVTNWPGWFWGFSWFNRFLYMNSRRSLHFAGFAPGVSFSAQGTTGNTLVWTVGAAGSPTAGTNTFTSSRLAGATFSIDRRGSGPMILGLDYALSNNNQTVTLLMPGDIFGPGELFIITFTQVSTGSTPSSMYTSPIAGYVYYWYVRDQLTLNTGSGVVKSKPENAQNANAGWRMVDAWDQMATDIFILWQMLEADYLSASPLYTSYDRTKINYDFFQPINTFNI